MVRHFVPCCNDSGIPGLYDLLYDVFYPNIGTGTFVIGGIIANAVARQGEPFYFGVNGVSRLVTSAYFGVNAVARQCYEKEDEIIPISAVPTQSTALTYSGSSQSPTWKNYDSSQLTIGGTTSGTNAGTYYATFTPKEGYCWSDGSTTAKSVSWTIGKKVISCSNKKINLSNYHTGGVVRLKLSGVEIDKGITTSDVHVTISPSKWAYFDGTWYDDGRDFYSKSRSGYGTGISHTTELYEWQNEHTQSESTTYTITVNFYNDNYYWDCSATMTCEVFGYLFD